VSAFPCTSFCHCLRALVALDRVEIAERVVAETVVLPLVRLPARIIIIIKP
jgi:hypothetical protein